MGRAVLNPEDRAVHYGESGGAAALVMQLLVGLA